MNGLTEFQKNILYILANDSAYGLAIKRELEDYYGCEINHGRLYPNLDKLVESEFVRKKSLDDRTNEYELTEKGEKKLAKEIKWKIELYANSDEEKKDEILTLVRDL
ncbi:MAG: helix-turn-helix transcriptional regulator [Halobacteria archaeon]|nr:helix-turn-helix transcriptional regulator [Halobacteria archaeon]